MRSAAPDRRLEFGRRPRVGRALTLCSLAVVSGCGGIVPPPSAPRPAPLTAGEVEAAAVLLALEDRREFRPGIFQASVTAPEASIRARAALAAGRVGGPQARPVVRSLLSDADSAVAASAAFMVGQLRDTAAVPVLVRLLDAELARVNPTVASEAATALGRIATPVARDALLDVLRRLDPPEPWALPILREALVAAWRAGETGTDPYLPWTEHPDPEIRWRAAYALARPARGTSIAPLLRLLDDPDDQVRAHAVRGLVGSAALESGLPPVETLNRLVQALDDEAYPVRIEAIRALATYDEDAAVQAVTGILGADRTPHEVAAAVEALGRVGGRAAGSLVNLRRLAAGGENPPHLRALAVASAQAIDSAGVAPLLGELAHDPAWRVRAATGRAAAQIGSPGFPVLERLARDRDPRVATAALGEAVEAYPPDGLPALRGLLLEALHADDVHVRAAAIRGLGRLGDPATYPALLDAFDRARRDPENDAALAAIDAFVEFRHRGDLAPERALFLRFEAPDDFQVRLRAVDGFGDVARRAWGDPLPIVNTPAIGFYRSHLQEWLAPPPAERVLPRVRIETEAGAIDLVLFGADAPLTVANFLALAGVRYFDGQEWPRVVPNFVVQGGDPRGDTSGGPGYSIRDEANRRRYRSGSLGMALSGPDTGGSQFFITHSPQPHLDGVYTLFGEVVAGHEVLEMILPGQRILSVRELGEES